jgi:acetyl esterase/lipase
MRGVISNKLKDFIEQVNIAALTAKKEGVKLTPQLVRSNLNKLSPFVGEGPKLSYVKDKVLTTESGVNIAIRIYSPEPNKALPVVIHYHGGGHMCGSINLYDAISRKIAKAGHCIVITPEYRLAPEYPYPHGINDCQFVLENYRKVLSELLFNDKLFIAGDSAGGAICTTLASNNLCNEQVNIDKQILIYPSVDYTMSFKSIEENGQGFLLENEKVAWYFEQYFQKKEITEQKTVQKNASPLFMPINCNMPETLIITAGCDPLRDEGLAYRDALLAQKVSVKHHHFDNLIHAYMLLDSLVESECEASYQFIGKFIKS